MALDTSLTLTQLLNPPTINTLLTEITTRLSVAGFSATDWATDSDARIILESEAITLSDLWQAILTIAKGGYLDTATGPWLDLLVQSRYQLVRKPAIQTIGLFTLTTVVGAGPYTFNAGDLVVKALGVDGVNYETYRSTNTAPVTINPNSTVTIQVSADNPGKNANIAGNSNLTVVTPRPGLTVTNPGVLLPAQIQTGITSGSYPLSGTSLNFSVTIDGVGPTLATIVFPTNYTTLTAVSTAINTLLGASAIAGKLTTTVVSGTLVFTTIHASNAIALDSLTIFNTGTANRIIGLTTGVTYTVAGTRAWITQYGQDAEADDSLIVRAKAEWGILGAGTRDAFISWATTADLQTERVVVYSNYYDGVPKSGAVTIYIAPTTGVFGVSAPIHVAAVYNYINPRMPIMSQLFVGAALAQDQVVTGDLYIKAAYDVATVTSAAKNAVTNYILSLGIGETLVLDKLIAAIVDVDGVYDVKLTNPISDIPPAAKNIIFTNSSTTFRAFSV